MTTPAFNAKSPTIKRILKEASELSAHPDPTLYAAPLESNLFEWHFTLQGPPATPYSNGIYHGRIILPPTYPLRPPSFRFLTPSGRFEVNREICLSISGHHEETWQPAWGIRTALWALRAFMEGDAKGQVGGMEMPEAERQRLAEESRLWMCHGCGGRSNETILQEEGGGGGGGGTDGEGAARTEQIVPEELRLGFMDEMLEQKKKKSTADDAAAPATETNPSHSSHRDVSNQTPITVGAPSTAGVNPVAPALSSEQSLSAQQARPPESLPREGIPVRSNGPPVWIDKAIAGVAAALALMVVKKLLM